MTLSLSQHKLLFVVILFLSVVVLFLSLFDILYGNEWLLIILALYAVLIIFAIVLLFLKPTKKMAKSKDIVEEFEKTLEGKLYHFKCPQCEGIFAIKKSKHNNKKPFTLTCPDCGTVGRISGSPTVVVEEIPEQKSENIKFKCKNCSERVSIWAEGTELVKNVEIYSCPYCGERQTKKNI